MIPRLICTYACQILSRSDGRVEKKKGGDKTDRQARRQRDAAAFVDTTSDQGKY